MREKETREGRESACTEGHGKSFPAPSLITWQPLREMSKGLTETTDLTQTKCAAKKGCTLNLRSKYICHKDQLGYLIIERWSNKLMVNTQL